MAWRPSRLRREGRGPADWGGRPSVASGQAGWSTRDGL